jgi:preprotein translocase subunit YajC
MGTESIMMIVFLVLMFGMFYFLIIRPQRKRQQEHQTLISSLQAGERVVTIGGIHGTIDSVGEDSLVLKVESGATIRMTRSAIAFREGEQAAG